MRRRSLTVVPLVLLLAACSHGTDTTARPAATPATRSTPTSAPTPALSEPVYPETRCDGTTVEMNECFAAVLDNVERRLNTVYTRVRRELLAREAAGDFTDVDEARESVHPGEGLRLAERAFLVYRDRMCDAMYDSWIRGSIRNMNALGCRISVTREQISQIEALIGP